MGTVSAALPRRSFGILLHPSSLPGREPIGTIGDEAVRWLDWLVTTGATLWQVLPLTVSGKEDSPYFSPSAFAGNPWLIDLGGLHTAGLLDEPAYGEAPGGARVPFDAMRTWKRPQLWAAAERFLGATDHPWHDGYDRFVAESGWLTDTAHFFALRDGDPDAAWWDWPEPLRRRDPDAVAASRAELADAIDRWQAVLWFFEVQWSALRRAANDRGIRILGDIPIYVAPDSADVWSHQEQFDLAPDGTLAVQSGVPPDYFSDTGQLWGNPLYRWDVMEADGFSWWLSRLRRCLEQSDLVRIDHFRALSAYWEVDGDAETAIDGRWVPGPGQAFVDAVRAAFPSMPVVAEDLGDLDDDVHALRDRNELPGMRVLQFAFDGSPDNPHLPQLLPERSIVYTGTHDNDTVAGWWSGLTDAERTRVAAQIECEPDASLDVVVWHLIEIACQARAVAAVVPIQDPLVLGSDARMNVPASTEGNWDWRLAPGLLTHDLALRIHDVVARTGRT
jgi:4-alpha-glucanotransferase